MVELTQKQKEYLPAIRWLISSGRRSGRSFLIAYATVQHILDAGGPVSVFDHYSPDEHCRGAVVSHMVTIINKLNQDRLEGNKLRLVVEGNRVDIKVGG